MAEQNNPDKSSSKQDKPILSDEEELEKLQKTFFDKRKEYTSGRNIVYSIVTLIFSTFIFFLVFLLLIPISSINEQLISKEFLNTSFASSLSLALSAGLLPLIIYIIARNMVIQKYNEELSSLFLQIKYLRNKILLDKQPKNKDHDDKTGESSPATTNTFPPSSPSAPEYLSPPKPEYDNTKMEW